MKHSSSLCIEEAIVVVTHNRLPVGRAPALYTEGPGFNPEYPSAKGFQVENAELTLAWGPSDWLPVRIDHTDLDGPSTWFSTKQLKNWV